MCGVSKMTVSRAIRRDPRVSEATRQRVLRAAEKVNYLPSGYGVGKMEGRSLTKHYYVLFHRDSALQDVFFGEIIRTMQQELFSRGLTCSLGLVSDEYAEFMQLYDMLQVADVAGILVVGPVPDESIDILLERFGEVVLVDNPGGPGITRPCSAVFCENTYGARLGVRHLLGLGRKRVLLVSGPEGNYFSQSLVDGYSEALATAHIPFDPQLVLRADFHVDGGHRIVADAVASGLEFDCLFSNDEMACGAVKALQEAGRSVPGDVAVVGFDNLPLGQAITPALTTVAVDREKMGRRAVELLLRLDSDDGLTETPERVRLLPRLLVRDSCGASAGQAGQS